MKRKHIAQLILLAFSTSPFLASAGPIDTTIQPDAGRTSQELKAPPALPKPSIELNIESPAIPEAAEGGATAEINAVKITGNTVYDEATLLNVIGNVTGKSYDLAGLKGIANSITEYYRNNGYPFARAYVPAQAVSSGELKIEVVEEGKANNTLNIDVIEGRYGSVTVNGSDKDAAAAQAYVANLKSGEVIESSQLERTMLILSDLPGVKATPVVSPGAAPGTGDITVDVSSERQFGGQVGFDNFGNRYTGRVRNTIDLYANSPFGFGDQLRVSSILTEEYLWFGSLNYSLPIGGSGLRANVGYAHTYYELGKEFSDLDANGTAQISNVGLSYPLIRSQTKNVTISGNYVYKKLEDHIDFANASFDKSSHSLPLALNFDVRDNFAGGGLTYGSASWTHGNLNLDSTLKAGDVDANTDGTFNKYNVDLVRIQNLPANFSLLARVSAQRASKNLDSSEKFGLGGINGIRAFPSGEGFGDEGELARLEVRYAINNVLPYVFYDAGSVRLNQNRFGGLSASDNRRTVSGVGLGVKYETVRWLADASLAWRTVGGAPVSDTNDERPMLWAGAKYKF